MNLTRPLLCNDLLLDLQVDVVFRMTVETPAVVWSVPGLHWKRKFTQALHRQCCGSHHKDHVLRELTALLANAILTSVESGLACSTVN